MGWIMECLKLIVGTFTLKEKPFSQTYYFYVLYVGTPTQFVLLL